MEMKKGASVSGNPAQDLRGLTQKGACGSILKVQPGPSTPYVICSQSLVGVWTHFVGEVRSYPCLGPALCPFDHAQTSMRWQGWVQVAKYGQRRALFLSLTWTAARDEPRLYHHPGDLRGFQLWVSRAGSTMRNRMHCIMGFRYADMDQLPPAMDVRKWLLHLWGKASTWPVWTNKVLDYSEDDVPWDNNPFLRLAERGEQ